METATAKPRKVHLDDLHFEHQRWTRELEFFRDEIHSFRARLDEVANRYTNNDVLRELDQFSNKFLIQEKAIHDLKQEVENNELALARHARLHPVAIDHVLFDDHNPLRERFMKTRVMLNELKSEFFKYLSKWM